MGISNDLKGNSFSYHSILYSSATIQTQDLKSFSCKKPPVLKNNLINILERVQEVTCLIKTTAVCSNARIEF